MLVATSARKRLVTAGLVATTITITFFLVRLVFPYLYNVFSPIPPSRLIVWIPIWLVAFLTTVGFVMLAAYTLMSASDDLDDIPREGYPKVAPRIAAKTFLAGILGAVAICAFILLPDI